MRPYSQSFLLFILFIFSASAAFSQSTTSVQTVDELKQKLQIAVPGSTILLQDGEYDFNGVLKVRRSGTEKLPIVIKAKNPGKAVIVGNSQIEIRGASHVQIEGLRFENVNPPAVELQGCQHVRISRNVFQLKETRNGSWVVINGIPDDTVTLSARNRIDHNHFERKSLLGNFITIEGTKKFAPQVSQHDRIDHNLFYDIGPRAENVLEAIRIGSSSFSLSSGYTILENNLFEKCDGDPEYVSIKASDNIIRGNTFRECLGSLSLRHGNRNTIEGNYILGNGRTGSFLDSTGRKWLLGTGGPRFCGEEMIIRNNYLQGLTGTRWDASFAITGGDAVYGDGKPLTKHHRIIKAVIENNVLVYNFSNFEISYDGDNFQGNNWPMPPKDMKIRNNIIVANQDTVIRFFRLPENTVWENNIVDARGSAVIAAQAVPGVIKKEIPLVAYGEIFAIAKKAIKTKPLTRKDVGPLAK